MKLKNYLGLLQKIWVAGRDGEGSRDKNKTGQSASLLKLSDRYVEVGTVLSTFGCMKKLQSSKLKQKHAQSEKKPLKGLSY